MNASHCARAAIVLGQLALVFGPIGTGCLAADEPVEQRPRASRKDVFGDPLPEGALVRMGTVRLRQDAPVAFLGFTAGGKQLVTSAHDGIFHVWELKHGREIRRFGDNAYAQAHPARALGIHVPSVQSVLSADGATLAMVGGDGRAHLWAVATGMKTRTLDDGQGRSSFPSLAFSPDGKLLAVRSEDPVVRLWGVASGQEVRQIGNSAQPGKQHVYVSRSGNALAFAPDGKTLAIASMELPDRRSGSLVRFHEMPTGKQLRLIKPFGLGLMNAKIAFSPDGKTIVWAGAGLFFFDAATGNILRKHEAQWTDALSTFLFSPDGKFLAVRSGNSATVLLLDAATGKEIRRLGDTPSHIGPLPITVVEGRQPLAFAPDSKTLAAASGHTVRLWAVGDGKEIFPVAGAR